MSAPEFSRPVDRRHLSAQPVKLVASEDERDALAERFGLVAIDRLEATVALQTDGQAVAAEGMLSAEIVQSCAVTGDDLPVTISEPLALRFVPEGKANEEEEVELSEEELDEIPYTGTIFDLGEARGAEPGVGDRPLCDWSRCRPGAQGGGARRSFGERPLRRTGGAEDSRLIRAGRSDVASACGSGAPCGRAAAIRSSR